ncbi:uncharacterized protein [Eurosta solidaginis]|uniref:uncharacterized protein n=1 Tax=Eurosta solidaginis TaxID=178769 RepID=UPI00353071C2
MRNMGRLFQYNRFGGNDQNNQDNRKDTQNHNCLKTKEPLQQQFDANCPLSYAELYPDCVCHSIEATASPKAANTSDGAETTTTMTSRSIDLALRKYQQWSSKFLATTTTTNSNNTMPVPITTTATTQQFATNSDCCVTQLSTSSSQKSNSCSYSTNPSSTATSDYYSRQTMIGGNVSEVVYSEEREQGQYWNIGGDRELLVSASKRPKVYNCMKDFLRRKLFQQRHAQQDEQQKERQQIQRAQLEATLCKSDTEEDVTSDYDEVDMLDSSYNADEEDASDCSSQCTFPLESDIEDVEQMKQQNTHIEQQQQHNSNHSTAPQKSISPQKSMLSLNCWQNMTHYTDSTTEPEEQEDQAPNEATSERQAQIFDYQNVNDDSDAGISDCCQLISEKSSPSKLRKRQQQKQKSCQKQKPKQQRTRYNRNVHDEEELLASSWYQPRITTKAALEYLQQAAPGTFLLRRKSRTYELCLRAETKVKHFIVVAVADNHYKLKGAKKEFTSLKALVTHHSVMAEQLPLTLTLPREYNNKRTFYAPTSGKCAAKSLAFEVSARALRSLRYADDFDTYESLKILGLLPDWQCEAN